MIIDQSFAARVIVERQADSHKGSYGRVLLVGGLYPYGGAIIMAALACVHSGAGLVTVATDRKNLVALHSHLPEAMAIAVDDEELLLSQLGMADLILIGPGLSENSRAARLFELVLAHVADHQVLVIDGSALRLLAKRTADVKQLRCPLVLTPHQKEWEALSGLALDQQHDAANQAALRRFPRATILVAKSSATKIYHEDQIYQLRVGGPYQATGGMGDTLAGMIAGIAVQFPESSLVDKVACATYLHSAIADELAKTAYVVLPTAISYELPRWLKAISTGQKLG
ncbi:TPA: NAD(P)H-hydrate dehydratase [Streptococcus equi subsp. zooepidemicus]|uniref:ADP-dependent (S)-NAD(P)H-hydrate dehydratase n=1 Tax=Streptococcus equi subsp. zooepidemicus (strain MGCS10565) TaxID=552526 RepID=B4U1W5_STREM|nr:NAD(P)H-hydrate dehydratase [Streptococcus equi]HEL1015482.1 NAD(P)H-hydrate dehydratase [Streptococcus equi subsp. ruminatorum]ACG61982.1 sugar kinase [Streptococcus equi subsp. zooepidemicus MGCS10565]MCD3381967.1 NAD(P)H-hydrate dehydratase [Streptococcus equi subsp. zooepidemicus]MCD3420142.1 NAD(P)H-hydrate dehydratase [Streptococcus equi subsp. zooepidemicus]MCD3425585.1 NAD(P)H-hydrate dehydratase [Streptococcus equi subsp. zooepidemicus]